MTRRALITALLATKTLAQAKRFEKGAQWMEISLERHGSGGWKTIDAGLVLNRDDLVRFRFRTNFAGYLYVINSGTSGTRSLLFPVEESGTNNQFAASTNYSIPATQAAFRVSGPAGHDVVYWLVSPVPLSESPVAALLREQAPARPPTLLPRCDDSTFRARGQCVDSSAGPRNIAADDKVSESVPDLPRTRKRELVIVKDKQVARVSAPESLNGPVIYEFRLAHR